MAQFSPNYVAELQRKHDLKYWKVYDRTKKFFIDSQETDVPLEASINNLQNTLDACTGDVVYLILYGDVPKTRREGGAMPKSYEMLVRLDNAASGAIRGVTGTVPGGPTFADVLALHNQIAEMRIAAVKAEMEAQISGPPEPGITEKFVEALMPMVPKIIGMFENKTNQVAGPPAPARSGAAPATSQLETISAKFEKVDPDYLNTLAKMAEYLEKNPSVLPNIKAIVGA